MLRLDAKSLTAILAVLLISGFSLGAQTTHAPEWTKLLADTTKVEAVLLSEDEQETIGKHQIKERTEHRVVDQQTISKLEQLFRSDDNWPGSMDDCIAIYGARLIFTIKPKSENESNVLVLNICFRCGDISASQNGKNLGYDRFVDRHDLLEIFHNLFPNDKQLLPDLVLR